MSVACFLKDVYFYAFTISLYDDFNYLGKALPSDDCLYINDMTEELFYFAL
jgi:hypothetical protein